MEELQVVREGVDTTVQTYVDLLAAMYSVQHLPGLKFALKVHDNIKTLEKELAPLNTLLEPTKEFEEFAALVREVAGSDTEKIKELEEQNREIVDHRLSQIQLAKEMLSNSKHISLRKFHEGDLSREITAAQLKAIEPLMA